jgi:hypothetical protein
MSHYQPPPYHPDSPNRQGSQPRSAVANGSNRSDQYTPNLSYSRACPPPPPPPPSLSVYPGVASQGNGNSRFSSGYINNSAIYTGGGFRGGSNSYNANSYSDGGHRGGTYVTASSDSQGNYYNRQNNNNRNSHNHNYNNRGHNRGNYRNNNEVGSSFRHNNNHNSKAGFGGKGRPSRSDSLRDPWLDLVNGLVSQGGLSDDCVEDYSFAVSLSASSDADTLEVSVIDSSSRPLVVSDGIDSGDGDSSDDKDIPEYDDEVIGDASKGSSKRQKVIDHLSKNASEEGAAALFLEECLAELS